MKKVLVLGGTGFIGSYLIPYLSKSGYEIYLLTRNPEKAKKFSSKIKIIKGNPLQLKDWSEIAKKVDIAINLVGQNIFGRWTKKYKELILESRIKSTENIVFALKSGAILVNASAVGYYGNKGEELVTEESKPGNDFLSKVCIEWEKKAFAGKEKDLKVIILRISVVLGKGGMFARILPIFKLGLGGTIGNGKQWFPWIHIEDLVQAIHFLIQKPYEGIYNLVSPNPVTNKEFTKILAKILKRPAFLKIPDLILKFILGEVSQLAIASIKAYPKGLLSLGFNFKFPYLEESLRDLIKRENL